MSYRKQQSEVTTIDAKKRALALLDDSSSDDESDQGNAELTKKEESLKAAKISRTGETKKELNIDTKPSDKTSPAVDDASNTKIMIEDSGIASDQKMVMTSMGVSIVCEYSAFSGPADKSSSSTNNNITSHGGTDISCPDLHPSSSAFTSTAKLTKALSTRHYFKLIEPNTRDELIYILARSCGDVHDSVMHTMAQLILSDKADNLVWCPSKIFIINAFEYFGISHSLTPQEDLASISTAYSKISCSCNYRDPREWIRCLQNVMKIIELAYSTNGAQYTKLLDSSMKDLAALLELFILLTADTNIKELAQSLVQLLLTLLVQSYSVMSSDTSSSSSTTSLTSSLGIVLSNVLNNKSFFLTPARMTLIANSITNNINPEVGQLLLGFSFSIVRNQWAAELRQKDKHFDYDLSNRTLPSTVSILESYNIVVNAVYQEIATTNSSSAQQLLRRLECYYATFQLIDLVLEFWAAIWSKENDQQKQLIADFIRVTNACYARLKKRMNLNNDATKVMNVMDQIGEKYQEIKSNISLVKKER